MKWLKSFAYAFKGLVFALNEKNFRLQLCSSLLVAAAGFFFRISEAEWLAVIICAGLVMAAETFNTAIEQLVNLVSPEIHPLAGRVKDLSAGAVMLCAIAAAIVGLVIFVPKVMAYIGS